MGKLYRFIGFENLIDIVLRNELTFVHPSLWEDPFELICLKDDIKKKAMEPNTSTFFEALLLNGMFYKIFCQSWSECAESDALWRIYSYSNKSIRIEIDVDDIRKLNDIQMRKVKYVNDVTQNDVTQSNMDRFLDSLSIKRTAFEHEKEVRLIYYPRFADDDNVEKHIINQLMLTAQPKFWKHVKLEDVEKRAEILLEETNCNLKKKIHRVSFKGIDNFINSVMLHPLAPSSLDETLSLFCSEKNLVYLGKSKLYENNFK